MIMDNIDLNNLFHHFKLTIKNINNFSGIMIMMNND